MKKIEKDITFIYMDSADKAAYEPIAKEARKRGYKVTFTDNKFQKCQIGFYCQHVNFPQYSRFSLIMLHDIIQQYSNWPDIWFNEPWDKYNIGILPSNQWEYNWNQCSQWKYTRPKNGIFKIGWPKADAVVELRSKISRDDYYKKYGMDISKKTVLYAPAWENDNKQDDFVRSMQQLDVNILIKQGPWSYPTWKKEHPEISRNIDKMNKMHRNLPGVTILDPMLNIFDAIAVSDILVSEESSTMCEASMLGIPAISVSDWLIPDTTPSRLPKCDYDFVITTTKSGLTECVKKILCNYDEYHYEAEKYAAKTFLNIGNTSNIIMDIIDDCVNDNPIRYNALIPKPLLKLPVDKNVKRMLRQLHITMYANWREQYSIFRFIWNVAKGIKDFIKKMNTNMRMKR